MTFIFMCEILVISYGQHSVHRYGLGTVFARVKGGAPFSNLSTFQNFPNLLGRVGWGVVKTECFPKFKIVKIILGADQENYGLFPHVGAISYLDCSPCLIACFHIYRGAHFPNLCYLFPNIVF